MDMVSELRWASILAKVTDANYQVGLARDVFNAATVGGTRFIGRPDLGRLAAGAKADVLLIDLDHLGGPLYADPIKALVDAGTGRDVHTVIVDGQVLVENRRLKRADEEQVLAKAREATRHYWEQVPRWRCPPSRSDGRPAWRLRTDTAAADASGR
jgi:cytosine/adenosine deaminase-related metal-dependent hydrolase